VSLKGSNWSLECLIYNREAVQQALKAVCTALSVGQYLIVLKAALEALRAVLESCKHCFILRRLCRVLKDLVEARQAALRAKRSACQEGQRNQECQ
jgi:hypothetical protein